jgi:hypothetical protein
MDEIEEVEAQGGKVFYCDTDGFHSDIILEHHIGKELGQLKHEITADKSIYLGKKSFILLNEKTGEVKYSSKEYSCKLDYEDWEFL